MYKPVVLVVLDGWGLSNNLRGNAIKKAKKPTIDKITKYYPLKALQASGLSVGIPWGESGNSEVGHMTIGAGKIIYQSLPRISLSIQDGSFFHNEALMGAIENVKTKKSSLHIMGLLSDGSVHSSSEHLYALIELASQQEIENLFIHIFTDGRDSSPTSGTSVVKKLHDKLAAKNSGKIATICGRNWAMDRNNNWDRIDKAYQLLTQGTGEKIEDPVEYLRSSYKKGVTDEYVEPGVVIEDGEPVGLIGKGDSVIFFNFREDRARQLAKAFVLPEFTKIKRDQRIPLEFVTLTSYEKDLPVSVAFPPEKVTNGLGELISRKQKKQLRIAETEKYAHVTYFLNGGNEEPWDGEDRILIPSPAVSKFDESPKMSAEELTQRTIASIEQEKYDFIAMNYANADMVGHTGNEEATIMAVEEVDKNLKKLIPAILKAGGCLLITADHGNAEEIRNLNSGEVDTEHSSNPVPLWYITPDNHREKSQEEIDEDMSEAGGLLSDIAPTILELMEIEKPPEMNGESLLSILK